MSRLVASAISILLSQVVTYNVLMSLCNMSAGLINSAIRNIFPITPV